MRVHMASRSPTSDDDTMTVRPSRGQPGDQVVDRDAGADVDARGRLAEHEHARARAPGSGASTTFCWLPPLSVEIERAGPLALTSRRPIQSLDERALGAVAEPAARRRAGRATDSDRFSATRELGDDALAAAVGGHERDVEPAGVGDLAASRGARPGSRMRPLTALGALPARA